MTRRAVRHLLLLLLSVFAVVVDLLGPAGPWVSAQDAQADPAAAAAAAAAAGEYVGIKVNNKLEKLVHDLMKNPDVYKADMALFCVDDVVAVEKQVVEGINYRFTVAGCDIAKSLYMLTDVLPLAAEVKPQIGACGGDFVRVCAPMHAVIVIFKSLSGSVEVTSVKILDGAGVGAMA